jgi:hypothetical protein
MMKPYRTGLVLVLALGACAGEQPAPVKSAQTYDGKCMLLGLEQVERPTDPPGDAVWLVATYRVGELASQQRVALGFQVTSSRVDELREVLTTHPTVLCSPGPTTGGAAATYQLGLPGETERGTVVDKAVPPPSAAYHW